MNPDTQLVVLTRDPDGNRRWAPELERAGFGVYCAPMITTEPLALTEAARRTLRRLSEFDWLVLTSPRAIPALHSLLCASNVEPGHVPPVAAVGERTAAAARTAGWNVTFQPPTATASALAEGLSPVSGRRILVAHTTIAHPALAATLSARRAIVTGLPVYSTQPVIAPDAQLEQFIFDRRIACFVFASPSAVAGLAKSLSTRAMSQAQNLPAAAIGPSTAAAATQAGFRHVHQAAAPSVKGVIAVLGEV